MNELLKLLNTLTADELENVIRCAGIMMEKKRQEEAAEALREQERLRQEKIEQEKRRQEEIAELQRRLLELQSQQSAVAETPAVKPAPAPVVPEKQNVDLVNCPHCGLMNLANKEFCANCGQKMVSRFQPEPKPVPQPAPAPVPQPAPAPAPAPVPQVRYADEDMKDWLMAPGEEIERRSQEIEFLQPKFEGKFAYHMEVTNKRILISRETSASRNATIAARMGGGLLGSLIAEGVKSATGAGPKPWMEIPLTAVVNCGLQNRKEFFIEADKTYVLVNNGIDKFLPNLVANAKHNAK